MPVIASYTSTRTASLLVGRLKRLKLSETNINLSPRPHDAAALSAQDMQCCVTLKENPVRARRCSLALSRRIAIDGKRIQVASGTPARPTSIALIVQRARVHSKPGAATSADQLHGFS